jgi:serine phosphatase RsbU (regulator of sigma subunit)
MRCAFSWITCSAPAISCHTGGDIACAVEARDAVRLLIGDVMGHGPRAAQTAAEVKRAFRDLAAGPNPLPVVAMRLHALVASRAADEEFVTAQLISVPLDDRAEPAIVCCGHPPPLLLRDGQAVLLDTHPPAPPLGLLDLAGHPARAGRLDAGPGDSVLLYTDGVTEARDIQGRAYPFTERAAMLPVTGESLPQALSADLLRHTGGVLRDDATVLHLRLADAQAPAAPPAPAVCAVLLILFEANSGSTLNGGLSRKLNIRGRRIRPFLFGVQPMDG